MIETTNFVPAQWRAWVCVLDGKVWPVVGWDRLMPVILSLGGQFVRAEGAAQSYHGSKVWTLAHDAVVTGTPLTTEALQSPEPRPSTRFTGAIQDRVLALLQENGRGQAWSGEQIARELNANSGSVSRTMRTLEARKLVRRGDLGWRLA